MKKAFTCLLIDPDHNRRNQFFLALDLLHTSKACICQDNTQMAINYIKEQPAFYPDYIFFDGSHLQHETEKFVRDINRIKRLKFVPLIWYADSYKKDQLENIRKAGFVAGIAKQDNLQVLKQYLQTLFQSNLSGNNIFYRKIFTISRVRKNLHNRSLVLSQD